LQPVGTFSVRLRSGGVRRVPSRGLVRALDGGSDDDGTDALAGVDMSGQRLTKGDRITALLQRAGHRDQPGVVTGVRKNSSGAVVFDIMYDGGDIETGAHSDYIRKVGHRITSLQLWLHRAVICSHRSGGDDLAMSDYDGAGDPVNDAASRLAGNSQRARPTDADGNTLVIGDKVEVRYKGKGLKFYAGKISAIKEVAGTFTFSIAYDDGDKEDGALPANIRRVGGGASAQFSSAAVAPINKLDGFSVTNSYRPGSALGGSNSPHRTNPQATDADGLTLAIGDNVEARYKGKGAKYYPGKISAIHVNNGAVTYAIAYNDGDKEDAALPANVRPLVPVWVMRGRVVGLPLWPHRS